MKNGDVLWNPYTDSHEELIKINNLRDTMEDRFCRIEFFPKKHSDYDKPETYKLKVDQATPDQAAPYWFTEGMRIKTADGLRAIVKRMIVTTHVGMLCGGSYILAGAAIVQAVRSCAIKVMMGSSCVDYMLGASTVGKMLESSRVGLMWESSRVGEMHDSSTVGQMCGLSKILEMRETSTVEEMRDSAKVEEMSHTVKIGKVLPKA